MIKPKKSLSQNFLQDQFVIKEIINALDLTISDTVVEIGGGTGSLTKELILKTFGRLDIYEVDDSLVPLLLRVTERHLNTRVINQDFLQADLSFYQAPWKVVSSLPYHITSPILHKLLSVLRRPERIILIMQKEVGNKILAKPPKLNYWAHIIFGYQVRKIMNVSATAFYPRPKVDSVAIEMVQDESSEHLLANIGFKNWEKFLHQAHKYPRKMLNKVFRADMLAEAGLQPTQRAEVVRLDQWLRLFCLLNEAEYTL